MKNSIIIAFICLGMTAIFASCGGNRNQNNCQASAEIMTVDELLANADTLIDKSIEIEAHCTHVCAHTGLRIFLIGTDSTKTIRVENAKKEQFDPQCAGNTVVVKGILKEERIDEAYLQDWESQITDSTAVQHGRDGSGCESEKKARNEEGNSVQERIDDFRQKIEERTVNEGKAYLSFYYVEGESYEIKEAK